MTLITDIKRVAVIGTGVIGASWATLFLARGLEVVATDLSKKSEEFLHRFVLEAWPAMQALGLSAGASRERLSFVRSLEAACSGADFVQENVIEREAIKVPLFAEIERFVRPNILISSSSSALTVSAMQRACVHPDRLILGHPFNPPHLMPLVEVAGGDKTSTSAIEAALAFYASLGKTPIRLEREIYGHVANRLQAAVFREALHLFQTGVASVADIDRAMTEGPGLRWALMGPFLTYGLAGGEGGMHAFVTHFSKMLETIWADLGTPSLDPQSQQIVIDAWQESFGTGSPASIAEQRDERILNLLKERNGKMRIGEVPSA